MNEEHPVTITIIVYFPKPYRVRVEITIELNLTGKKGDGRYDELQYMVTIYAWEHGGRGEERLLYPFHD